MANEPDIAYPFLYNYIKGSEWKSGKRVSQLIDEYYHNAPNGLPGNDDTGTMSAWLVYAMMGFYPTTPAQPDYAIIEPRFKKITIHLNPEHYKKEKLIINRLDPEEAENVDKKSLYNKDKFFISHDALMNIGELNIAAEK